MGTVERFTWDRLGVRGEEEQATVVKTNDRTTHKIKVGGKVPKRVTVRGPKKTKGAWRQGKGGVYTPNKTVAQVRAMGGGEKMGKEKRRRGERSKNRGLSGKYTTTRDNKKKKNCGRSWIEKTWEEGV